MAITNAQQAKQLLEYGGRVGLQGGGADMGTVSTPDRAANKELSDRAAKAQKDTDRLNQQIELRNEVRRQEAEKQEELVERFRNKRFRGSNFPGLIGMGLNLSGPLVQKGMTINRNFFLDKVLPSKNFKDIDFTTLTPSQQDALFSDYMSERLSGNIDAYGNQLMTGDSNDAYPIPRSGIMAEAPSDMDQEPEIEEDEGLFRRFRADGGRIGLFKGAVASGENISPGTDVRGNIRNDNPFTGGGPNQSGPSTNVGGGDKPIIEKLPVSIVKEKSNLQKIMDIFGINNEPENVSLGTGLAEEAKQNIIKNKEIKAQGMSETEAELRAQGLLADGGRAGLAGGGMPYEGGIMDLESARQMYGLGKLVKKIGRSVKKIAKSPIGKAALLYTGLGGLGSIAQGGTFFGNFASPINQLRGVGSIFSKGGLENIMSKAKLGEFVTSYGDQAPVFEKNFLGKILTSPSALIAGASAVSGLLTAEQEEEAQQIADNTGIDIAEIRANPDKYLSRRFRAEGGSTEGKEPVAKKVMPLLDMDGKEKDYRETGGFVDMGRMEKADDVPARLSKNEFVFTADAVRNAGDGSVDKGAEVMYNMMKNLEAGGDVSEESQGMDGARKMFQTSQRLEEVL